MKISCDWLAEMVAFPPVAELVPLLTHAGIEVEELEDPAARVRGVVVALIHAVEPHPHADRLRLCEVDDGQRRSRVVCGAPNAAVGLRVPLARVGAVLPGLTVERRVIREVESDGMLCSRAELGLEEKSAGLWELPADFPLGGDPLALAQIAPALTLGITPNRPDLLSHLGVAREIAAATGTRLKAQKWRLVEKGPDVSSLARVLVDDPAGCRRYVARVVRNLRVGPSPTWLQQRLLAIGQRPINNVVDVTNYVLHELGHPLHAFDLARLGLEANLPTVRVRRARAGESLVTLDGVTRKLEAEDLLISDAERPLALAGVIGGQSSEVTATTSAVLLECAWFDPVTVRRTAKRHGLHTEASHRFERGADPAMVVRAIDRCAQLLAELAEGEVAKGVIDVAQKQEPREEITLRLGRIGKLLGVSLPAETVVQLLDPLEVRCVARTDGALRFQAPSFRPDLTREIDLIEELARRYGYDRIPERLPGSAGPYQFTPLPDDQIDRLRGAALAAGLAEAVHWGFGHPAAQRRLGEDGEEPLRLQNPLGDEQSALRTTLLPGLLATLQRNVRQGATTVRLFEIGTTFHRRTPAADEPERERGLPREELRLAFLLWGERHPGRWYQTDERIDFTDVAGLLENLIDAAEAPCALTRQAGELPSFHPLAGCTLWLGEQAIGRAGLLHPTQVAELELGGAVGLGELSLTALRRVGRRAVTYQPLPRFPGTRRDVALVVDEALPVEELRAFLTAHAGGTLGAAVVERVWLFDVYRGRGIAKAKKSAAFAIEYRDRTRTLTDAEVNGAFEAVVRLLVERFGAEVRG